MQWYKDEIEEFKKILPATNVKWDEKSNYTFQPYFVEQKARGNGTRHESVKVIEVDR